MRELRGAVARAAIPGLLAGALVDTGAAALVTSAGAAQVRMTDGAVPAVWLLAAPPSPPAAVAYYLERSASLCGYELLANAAGTWIGCRLVQQGSAVSDVTEICRIGRQMVQSAAWLANDPAGRDVWAKLAGFISDDREEEET